LERTVKSPLSDWGEKACKLRKKTRGGLIKFRPQEKGNSMRAKVNLGEWVYKKSKRGDSKSTYLESGEWIAHL